jgi:hypothetical protein
MELTLVQIIGYIASIIIAISMTMSSIVKFRWINLVGATTFSAYGFIFGAYPVGVLNGFIVLADLYYLRKIYFKNDIFDTLEIRHDNKYLLKFLDFHEEEIQKYFPGFKYKPELNTISFFVLRNMAVAGIFLAHEEGKHQLKVGLDYAVPEYRDFKSGKFVYDSVLQPLKKRGITTFVAEGQTLKHAKYLKKCGFTRLTENTFTRELI